MRSIIAASSWSQPNQIETNGRVTLLQLKDASAVRSEVLRSFKGKGEVFAIDRNGVIFGAEHPLDTRAITTAAMTPTTDQPG